LRATRRERKLFEMLFEAGHDLERVPEPERNEIRVLLEQGDAWQARCARALAREAIAANIGVSVEALDHEFRRNWLPDWLPDD
jgi:hypothetical protein